MLTAFIIIFTVLIFPIFFNIDIKYNKADKKVFYRINIFKITILNGYVELIKEGIAIHLTKRKAIIIPFNKMFEMRNKVKPLKDYHIIKLKLNIKFGIEESMIVPIALSFLSNYVLQVVKWFLFNKKPYVKLLTNFSVYENDDVLDLVTNATVVFNLLMVVISFIKIGVEKIYYAVQNRKQ